jgi:malonyl CoA-acyl carrier protein transacylase
MAFHSPIMTVIHDELEAFIAAIPVHSPRIPVISNTTMAPYPSDPGEIRRILMAHLESPVHWMNNVQTLWNDYGVRLFVEVGPGETLSNLIADTLPEPACIQTCLSSAEGLTCKTALAQLFVQGHLKVEGEPRFVFAPAPTLRQKPVAPVQPVSVPLDPAPALMRQASPAGGETPGGEALMERLIRIIMDATGFERDEIQPDMDLKRDLSIRSSRLPIIMDAAERQFDITIEMEDFIDVRTVKDIAQRIATIIAMQGGASLQPETRAGAPDPVSARKSVMKTCRVSWPRAKKTSETPRSWSSPPETAREVMIAAAT